MPKTTKKKSAPNAPLQLKVPLKKKNEYKAYAAIKGKAMSELFLEMFEEYKKKYG